MAEYRPYQHGTYRAPIYRAAIIPYTFGEDGNLIMMFMQPSDSRYGGDAFQLAKGHVDPGEDPETAAIREGGEELGLKPDNILSIFHLGRYLKYTDVYCCEIRDRSDFGEFEDETGAVAWMTVDEFAEVGRDIHRQLVDDAAGQIAERFMQNLLGSLDQ